MRWDSWALRCCHAASATEPSLQHHAGVGALHPAPVSHKASRAQENCRGDAPADPLAATMKLVEDDLLELRQPRWRWRRPDIGDVGDVHRERKRQR